MFRHRRWCSVGGDLLVPYSLDFMGAKIEKPSAFHNGEGMKNTVVLVKNDNANIVNMNGKTKPLPIILSNLGGNQGRYPRIIL